MFYSVKCAVKALQDFRSSNLFMVIIPVPEHERVTNLLLLNAPRSNLQTVYMPAKHKMFVSRAAADPVLT